tara:strand:+ start:74 stop:697 length:624 start_codon:yes stop_codon:yes gene_type:complete
MFEYDKNQNFTESWFDAMIPLWDSIFTQHIAPIGVKNVLEIGCYEGRATSFVCEKYLQKGTNYDVVDTFGGSLEETGMERTAKGLLENDFIYDNFNHNISFYPDISFNIDRGFSQYILPKLEKQGNKYDFIYIDASHRADDTFMDAYYSHKMLNSKGLLIFDDFGWKDPNQPHKINSPQLGIEVFFTMYGDLYDLVYQGYQIAAIKK